MFNMRDIYGNTFGVSTQEQAAPEATAQEKIVVGDETAAAKPATNHNSILVWMGLLLVFIVLFQMGGGK